MSSLPKVAVAGAGNIGIPIVNALLNSGHYAVTVLSRSPDASTKYADKIPSSPNLSYATVDYDSVSSLTETLQDHFAVVSTLTTTSVSDQKPLIDASIAAGVTRFIPSEFGSNTLNPNAAQLPVFGGKLAINKLLADLAEKHPNFSYTCIMNGPFFDWGLDVGFLINPKKRSATLYDGGDRHFSTTTLASVGKAVVGVLQNLDATKNKHVRVHDTVITQNKIIEITKKINGLPWDVKEATLEETRRTAGEKLKSGKQEEIGGAMIMYLMSAVFGGDEYGADFSKEGTDNEVLGVPVMTEEEVEDVVRRYT